jgi:dolichol-phosphate mannosyltransferase
LTIVIPCHNEEEAIIYTLSEIYNKLQYDNFDVLIVNDHSSDKTVQVINKFISDKTINNLHIVENKRTGCFANALITGLENFDTDLVIPMMGDLCDEVETIPELVKLIENGCDIAAASRYMKGGKKINSPRLQGFFSWAVCLSLKILCNLPTWDVSNAYKMYKKDVIKKVFPILEGNAGTDFSMQLFLKALKAGFIAKETPTTWTGRIYGKAKFDPIKLTPRYWRWYKYALISTWFPKFVDKA